MIDIKDIKKYFPWFKNNPEYVYMDSGATSLKPQPVIDAIVNYYTKQGTNPHNTDSIFANRVANDVEEARKIIASFINANKDEVAFNSGATEALNLVANGLKEHLNDGDEILLTYAEHASNILPWMNIISELKKDIKIKYAGKKFNPLTGDDLINAVTDKTKIVAFSTGHNLTGQHLDDNYICRKIKEKNPNVFIVLDATQSVQHFPINVKENNCDFLVCSGHKILGPTGIGLVYIKKEIQSIIKPFRFGGGMNLSIEEFKFEEFTSIAKYEGGTQNIDGILGWAAAIKFLLEIGFDQIQAYELELANYAREKLGQLENIIIYNQDVKSPTIAFNYKGVFCQDLASYLGNKKIIVRAGLSCAKLYCNLIDTKALVRASLYIYNTKEDIDYLYDALKDFKKGDEFNDLV